MIILIIFVLVFIFFIFETCCPKTHSCREILIRESLGDNKNSTLIQECIMMAYLCLASYYTYYPDTLESYIKLSGIDFLDYETIYDSYYQSSGILGETIDKIYIIFTGTNLENYMTIFDDLDYSLVPFPDDKSFGNVCYGFLMAYKSLEPKILDFIGSRNFEKEIVVTGHSLGGAMANICTVSLNFKT